MDINDIETIINILKANDIVEFELDHDGTRISLKRGVAGSTVAVQAGSVREVEIQPAIVGASVNGQGGAASSVSESGAFTKVESPIVGTFFRKPSPDADPFVREGDRVKKGDTLCIVEAMKVMNEIESPCSGVVQKVMPSDGEVVEFGEVLFLISPEA